MKHFDCAFIGDVNPDIVLTGDAMPVPGREIFCGDFYLTLGGSTSICAGAFSSLGGSGVFFGRAGCDRMGQFALEALRECGVDVSGVKTLAGTHSPVTVSFGTPDDRALVTYPGTCGLVDESDIPVDEILSSARHIHIGSFFLQHHLAGIFAGIFEAAGRAGITTSLDAGWDPEEKWDPTLFELLRFTDIFFPNESEAIAVTKEPAAEPAARRLAEFCRIAVVKRGSKGSFLSSEGTNLECPIYDARKGKDFTGAGDSYNAGFLCAFLSGMPLAYCMKYGSAAAALRISADRRTRPFASLPEVKAVVTEDTERGCPNFR
ncbi:MAG: carbohydrate kinase family protein [Synergistaceae bacterium]|jgi:sugar/nucleoside kinase (ribokinase family)|nr:carbohydrate kinase family protein [Synergistaceae bacterium]